MYWKKKEQLFDGIDELADEIITHNAAMQKKVPLSPKYVSPRDGRPIIFDENRVKKDSSKSVNAGPPLFLFMPRSYELHKMIIKSCEYQKPEEVPV